MTFSELIPATTWADHGSKKHKTHRTHKTHKTKTRTETRSHCH